MADSFVQGRKLYVGGRDLSGDWTAMSLKYGRDPIDFTRGSDSTRVSRPGLRVISFEAEGIANLGLDLADEELYTMADSLTAQPIIVSPIAGAIGDLAYGFQADIGDFEPFGDGAKVGERLDFRVSARASKSRLVRGVVVADAVARGTTFTTTPVQISAVSASQKIYACVMVLAASGTTPTLAGKIQSDNGAGFSSPFDAVTFTQKTAAGQFEWVEVNGPLTDDYFRFSGTLGGTSPNFTIVSMVAIA